MNSPSFVDVLLGNPRAFDLGLFCVSAWLNRLPKLLSLSQKKSIRDLDINSIRARFAIILTLCEQHVDPPRSVQKQDDDTGGSAIPPVEINFNIPASAHRDPMENSSSADASLSSPAPPASPISLPPPLPPKPPKALITFLVLFCLTVLAQHLQQGAAEAARCWRLIEQILNDRHLAHALVLPMTPSDLVNLVSTTQFS